MTTQTIEGPALLYALEAWVDGLDGRAGEVTVTSSSSGILLLKLTAPGGWVADPENPFTVSAGASLVIEGTDGIGFRAHAVALEVGDAADAARYRWLRDGNAYAPEEHAVSGGVELDALCDQGRGAIPISRTDPVAQPLTTQTIEGPAEFHGIEAWPAKFGDAGEVDVKRDDGSLLLRIAVGRPTEHWLHGCVIVQAGQSLVIQAPAGIVVRPKVKPLAEEHQIVR